MSQDRLLDCRACGAAMDDWRPHGLAGVTSDAKPHPDGAGTIAICHACGLVQKPQTASWQRRVQAVYDQYDIYHQSGGAEQQVFFSSGSEARSRRILWRFMVENTHPVHGRLLDVGCGTGAMLRAASTLLPDWALVGHDLDGRHEATVTSIPGVERLHTGAVEEIRDRFDLITLSHVLEHVPEPVPFLTALSRLLKPKGVILVQVPDLEANPFDLMVVDHASHFTEKTLSDTLTRAGLCSAFPRHWVPKELTAVAHPERFLPPPRGYDTEDGRNLDAALVWLYDVLDEALDLARKTSRLALFGTSIAAVWLYGALAEEGAAIAAFVDEDASRVGRTLFGVPVVHPSDVETGTTVYVPMPPEQARTVTERLSAEYRGRRWVAA